MHTVTSGHVRFSRTKKDDEYGINRTAEVSLAFQMQEGAPEDGHLLTTTAISSDCVRFVNAILSRAPGAELTDVQLQTGLSVGAAPVVVNDKVKLADAVTEPAAPAPRTRATKPPAVPPAAPAATKSAEAAASMVEENPSKPASAAAAPAPAQSPGPASAASAAEMSDEDLFSAQAPDVTDEDITSAITRKNAEIMNPKAIRELIGKFIAPPGQARQIDKALRHKFLEDLAALTKTPAGV